MPRGTPKAQLTAEDLEEILLEEAQKTGIDPAAMRKMLKGHSPENSFDQDVKPLLDIVGRIVRGESQKKLADELGMPAADLRRLVTLSRRSMGRMVARGVMRTTVLLHKALDTADEILDLNPLADKGLAAAQVQLIRFFMQANGMLNKDGLKLPEGQRTITQLVEDAQKQLEDPDLQRALSEGMPTELIDYSEEDEEPVG